MAERKFPDWATTFIPDIGNGDPNRVDPGAPKQASGWEVEKPLLQTMNWLQNLFGHFVRANNEFKIEANGYEAEAGEIIIMDNSAGAATGLLPANPIDGQWVAFAGLVPFETNNVNVDGNGNDIMVLGTTDVDLDVENRYHIFFWREADSLWKINFGLSVGVV